MVTSSSVLENTQSFSGNIRTRLKKRTLLFRYLAEINLIFGAWYLYWRITHSVNFDALWLAIPLLLAEIYSYCGGVMFTIGLWRPVERQVKSFDKMTPPLPKEEWPTVDVFVTCYNEPTDIVEATAKSALDLDYPPTKLRVYILDDGNSPAMRAMTEKLSLEDLQTPLLQAEAERIDGEREHLNHRLKELKNLAPDMEAAEKFLQGDGRNSNNTVVRFLHSVRQFTLGLPPQSQNLQERLKLERELLEEAIYQKEIELVELARLRYIARPKPAGKAHHAKAGNINYALFEADTSGQFIITMDADHILEPRFIKRVLPYFYTYDLFKGKYESNRVGFVQTPQDFYNLPKGDVFGHSAHLFYGPILQGKDGMNAAFYTGTNAMIRREAIVSVGLQHFSDDWAKDENKLYEAELIGGVSSISITEDMNTAMRLHSGGWKSIYHNELMAKGLAPDDLSSTLKQRLRWAQGTIQVLLRENPLFKPGLSFWQRLQYFQTMFSYFSGFATLVFIICPIIYFFTGVIPVKSYGSDFAIHFFPAFILNRMTFLSATWGIPAAELWRSEQYAIALFPLFIQAVISVFTNRPIKFQVTPKQRQAGIYLRLVWPQLLIFVLTILGMLWSLFRFATGSLEYPWVHLLNAGWAIYNMSLLWSVIHASMWQPPADV